MYQCKFTRRAVAYNNIQRGTFSVGIQRKYGLNEEKKNCAMIIIFFFHLLRFEETKKRLIFSIVSICTMYILPSRLKGKQNGIETRCVCRISHRRRHRSEYVYTLSVPRSKSIGNLSTGEIQTNQSIVNLTYNVRSTITIEFLH